jgi:hypothetical protein
MRKRIYNWQGQRFAYIWLEGEPGQSLEKQSQGFDRAGPELASLGLALDKNVVRTRVYGHTRDARNVVSAARGRAFSGQARAATSSFISPDHLDWYSDVALELWAMAALTEGVPWGDLEANGGRKKYRREDGVSVDVTPIRFVGACQKGHLQDIDWRWLLHKGSILQRADVDRGGGDER